MSDCRDDKTQNAPQDGARKPTDLTKRFATVERRDRDGRNSQIRVGLNQYEGQMYLAIQTWRQDVRGDWWPSKYGGVNFRRHEVLEVLAAVQKAAADLGLLPPDAGSGKPAAKPKAPPELPAYAWKGYGGHGVPREKPDARVDHAALYAGGGIRKVNLSEACKSAAFEMLVPKKED